MFLICISVGAIVLIGLLAYQIQGPPYVVTTESDTRAIVETAHELNAKRILDIGSGNGQLVIALAQQGIAVDGIELNPLLVWRSRRAIKIAGLTDKARIIHGNFWTYNTANYDLVTLYLIEHIMPRVEKKLMAELKPGSHIVSNYFDLPGLKPKKISDRIKLYSV